MNEMPCQLSNAELESALKRRIKMLESRIEAMLADKQIDLEERQRKVGILQHKLLFARTRLRLLKGAKLPEIAEITLYQTKPKK